MQKTRQYERSHHTSSANATWKEESCEVRPPSLQQSLLAAEERSWNAGDRSKLAQVLRKGALSSSSAPTPRPLPPPSGFGRAVSPDKRNGLIKREKLGELLSSLKTSEFVGHIDPEYHSPYLSAPKLPPLKKAARASSAGTLSSGESFTEWKNSIKKANSTANLGDKKTKQPSP